ncbi:Co-chaperone protein HscB [mine drainage metagenome]|uniref:Co-chaperone protein HscB n=1 Tax=mine drainage metagenome TaxID=410659 RepID=A0A1J5S295_9ZZZZ
MDFTQDHFALFGLPRRYALDNAELDRLYRELQARVHPDKFAHQPDAERRLAMQWATRINEAYQTLRQPLARAKYLLSLAGVEVEQERRMSPEFLMQQMEWREAVAEARAALAVDELEALHARLKKEMREQYLKLAAQLNAPDVGGAADLLRQLMFQEKLLADIDDALAAVEA